jgi:hypothetical protein
MPSVRDNVRPDKREAVELLTRIADTLDRLVTSQERLEQLVDEFMAVYLDARFPFGQGTDRWARHRPRGLR